MGADGTVDRSAPLWRNRDEVKAERARTARLVNEHCHTVAAFHPGGFKDIGRAEDTPKWRTPTGVYLKVVAASTEGAGWAEKDAAERAQYAAARKSAELAEPKRTRKEEIAAARERGEKPPRVRPTLRQRLARAEADRSELAADLDRLAAERARQAAGKQQAKTRVDRAEGRVRELEELNAVQTKYVTDWHGDRGAELPDLATVEGQREAWASMRAWEIEERKRRKAEAAAKKDEHEKALADERDSTQEKIAEAVQRALETERERQEAEPDPAPPVPADLPVPEAPPAAVPAAAAQPDLPATWTLPLGELMKAGGEVATAAGKKWLMKGFLAHVNAAGRHRRQPGADVHARARPVAEAARELALRGHGPLCGRGGDRTRDARQRRQKPRRAQLEGRSRGVVARARDRRAQGRREPPRWLEEQFPDLDDEYGPKIRTREYHGEHARTYVGEMSGGEPHGAGTETWTSGAYYEGAFENGHRHGQGVFTYAGGARYEGAWQKGLRHGQGVYDFADGRRYEGEWRDGLRHGQGIQTWSDGQRYEGAFENDALHGQGVYDFADGSRYEGGWKAGERHGPGIETTADGKRTEACGRTASGPRRRKRPGKSPGPGARGAGRQAAQGIPRRPARHRDAQGRPRAGQRLEDPRRRAGGARGRRGAQEGAPRRGRQARHRAPAQEAPRAARDRERGDGRG